MSENQASDSDTELPNDPSQVSADAADQVFSQQELTGNPQDESADNPGEQQEPTDMDDVDTLKRLLAEKEDQLLRSAAETENVRKRGRRETEEARKYASAALLGDLLNVLDDLNRALDSAEENQEVEGLLAGVKMVASQLETVLEKHDCRKIDALGQPFDPNLHEAIQMQPSEKFDANHVSLEARTGYQYHDRVLRTSQVFVSTGNPNGNDG